jgi:hypothetical protein
MEIILVGILFFFNLPFIQQPRPLLTMEFSCDSKADREPGHKVIRYSLTEEGREVDERVIFDWAVQDRHDRELPKDVVTKITELLRGLPKPRDKNIPKDWLVILTFSEGNKVRVCEYHRKRLPSALKEVLMLLGGIRFELKDSIAFSTLRV